MVYPLLSLKDEKSLEEIQQYNISFHSVIRQTCNNNYLVHQIETLRTIDYSFRKAAHMKYIEEPIPAHQEHKAILEAISSHNSSLSEKLMVSHIRRVALFVADCAKKFNN